MNFKPKNAEKIADLIFWASRSHGVAIRINSSECALPNPEFRPANCINPINDKHHEARHRGYPILSIELTNFYIDLVVDGTTLQAGAKNLIDLIEEEEDKYNVLFWINAKIHESQYGYSCINFREKGSGDCFQPKEKPLEKKQWREALANKTREIDGSPRERFTQRSMMQIQKELNQGGLQWKFGYYESIEKTEWAKIEEELKRMKEPKEASAEGGPDEADKPQPAPLPW